MIQLQSDTLFFIGNFTIFTEIETQSFVAPLVTRKRYKTNQYFSQLTDSLMHTLHLSLTAVALFLQRTQVQQVDPSWWVSCISF